MIQNSGSAHDPRLASVNERARKMAESNMLCYKIICISFAVGFILVTFVTIFPDSYKIASLGFLFCAAGIIMPASVKYYENRTLLEEIQNEEREEKALDE